MRRLIHQLGQYPSLKSAALCLALGMFVGCKPEAEIQREAAQARAQQEADAAKANQPPMENQVAKVGVGVKGNSLDDISDNDARNIIAGPAKAFFNTKEKIVFEIQLPQAINLYQAEHGRFPRSHEEYMDKIVKFNQIKLPELPKKMVYRYHPDTNELWVEAETTAPTAP